MYKRQATTYSSLKSIDGENIHSEGLIVPTLKFKKGTNLYVLRGHWFLPIQYGTLVDDEIQILRLQSQDVKLEPGTTINVSGKSACLAMNTSYMKTGYEDISSECEKAAVQDTALGMLNVIGEYEFEDGNGGIVKCNENICDLSTIPMLSLIHI